MKVLNNLLNPLFPPLPLLIKLKPLDVPIMAINPQDLLLKNIPPPPTATKKEKKKTRKNYGPETLNVLMGWYLENDGRAPTPEEKKMLSLATGKTEAQVGTWFHNARRRHASKVGVYKSLCPAGPSVIYDHKSMGRLLRRKAKSL